jgi:hypothetical protein
MSDPITHYTGSKGPVEIAKMAYPHLVSAHAKLVRDRIGADRDEEIAAMADDIFRRDKEYEAEQAANGGGEAA